MTLNKPEFPCCHGGDYDQEYHISLDDITEDEFDLLYDGISEHMEVSDHYYYEVSKHADIYTSKDYNFYNIGELRDWIFKTLGRYVDGSINEIVYSPCDNPIRFDRSDYAPDIAAERVSRMVS